MIYTRFGSPVRIVISDKSNHEMFDFARRILVKKTQMSADGKWLGRICPTCHQMGWVGVYASGGGQALRYIQSDTWECAKCQKNIEEAQNATL